jgi:hypothetical protein
MTVISGSTAPIATAIAVSDEPHAADTSGATCAAPAPTDPFSELATLLLNVDFLRQKIDHQDLIAARREQVAELDQEVGKLHEAAQDMRAGAWAEGAVSLTAIATDAAPKLSSDGCTESTVMKALGLSADAAKSLAKPLGTQFGDAAAADANAAAKQAEKQGSLAAARAEEAQQSLNRTDSNEDRTLAALDKILDSRAQANLAVIANV